MDIFLLYLFTRVNAVVTVVGVAAILSLIAGAVFLLLSYGLREHTSWDSVEKKARDDVSAVGAAKWSRRLLLLALPVFSLVYVATPNQKDLAIIVGGHLAIKASQSDTAKKVYAIVQDVLDEKLAEIAKKKAP